MPDLYEYSLNVILDNKTPLTIKANSSFSLTKVQLAFNFKVYLEVMQKSNRPSAKSLSDIFNGSISNGLDTPNKKTAQFIKSVKTILASPSSKDFDFEFFNEIIEAGRNSFGERAIIYGFANQISLIKRESRVSDEYRFLFDSQIPLLKRLSYARTKIRDYEWWKSTFEAPKSESDKILLSIISFTWSGYALMSVIVNKLDKIIEELTEDQWYMVYNTIENTDAIISNGLASIYRVPNDAYETWKLSDRTWMLLSSRFKKDINDRIFFDKLYSYEGNDMNILRYIERSAYGNLNSRSRSNEMVQLIKSTYGKYEGQLTDFYKPSVRFYSRIDISKKILTDILSNPDQYPSYMVKLANMRLRSYYEKNLEPVATIMKRQAWVGNF